MPFRALISRFYPRHPLICGSSALPPAMLLAAKLVILHRLSFRVKHGFDAPFLPFWPVLDQPVVASLWPWFLGVLFFSGTILVLFNFSPRIGSALAGAALVLDTVAGRLRFSNSVLLLDVLLLVIALSGPGDHRRFVLRAQLALVYFGAFLNKALHPDWPSGRFFAFWTREILHLDWFTRLDQVWSGHLSVAMSWVTIVTEGSLAVLVCWPRHTRVFIALGLTFHVGMLVFTGGVISWVFLHVMLVAYLAFWTGPVSPSDRITPSTSTTKMILAWPEAVDLRQFIAHACVIAWFLFRRKILGG